MLTVGSLFSGYLGLDLALKDTELKWVSDIESGPCKLLQHRFPNVPNLGDITQVDWSEVEPNVPRLASRGENYPLTKPKKQDSVIEYTMSPTSRERVGYPTQKPLDVLRQIVGVHSRRGDLVIDPFMGSGSTLIAAKELGREYAGADINPDARQIALERLGQW